MFQVGQKDRKIPGRFGAVFVTSENNVMAYASRPGRRIWKSDMRGVVLETLVLKDIIKEPHHSISFCHSSMKIDDFQNFQFGPLKEFCDKLLFSWSKKYIVMTHPESGIVGSICGFDNITDVATWNDEIYVLQGIRHLLCLAVKESNWVDNTASVGDVFPPLQKTHSELSLISQLDTNTSTTKDNPAPKLLHWFKRKFSDASSLQSNEPPSPFRSRRAHTVSPDLPDVVELDKSLSAIHVYEKDHTVEVKPLAVAKTSSKDVAEDIVYHPKLKKKKKKKKKAQTDDENNLVQDTPDSASVLNAAATHSELKNKIFTKSITEPVDTASENTSVKVSIDSVNIHEDPKCSQSDTVDKADGIHIRDANSDKAQSIEETKSAEKSFCNETEIAEEVENVKHSPKDPENIEQTCSEKHDQDFYYDDQNNTDIYSNSNSVRPKSQEPKILDDPERTLTHEEDNEEDSENNNSMISSSDSFKDIEPEGVKLGSDWVEYSGPGQIISVSASSHHVFCVDSKESLYMSDFPVLGLVWRKLQQPAEQISVSPSEDIVWALYKGTVYAMCRNSGESWKNLEWIPIAREVSYIAVDDTEAWFITSSGKLTVMKDLSILHPYSYPQNLECPFEPAQVACRDKIVWVVTKDSRVFCRSDSLYVENRQWNELRFPPLKLISMVAFSHDDVVLIVSGDETLWFRTGVTCSMPFGDGDVWEVEKSNYVYESSNNARSAVMKVVTNDLLSSFIYTQYPSIVTASKAGAWYCKQMDKHLYSNQKGIAGHMWSAVVPVGTVPSMKWKMIAAEAFVNSKGILWGTTVNNELFCFKHHKTITSSVAVEPPRDVTLKCVVSTSSSLWILSTDGSIYIRKELSRKCPQGVWWQPLDITQLAESKLCHISCSMNSVWACDVKGFVYFRVGSLNPPPTDHLSQAWIEVDSGTSPTPVFIEKVYVSYDATVVWAIDSKQNVYARRGVTPNLPVGNRWVFVPSPHAKQLCISKNTVWLLKRSGKIFRRYGITKSNCSGDYWKQIPGRLSYLSVTVDDDLWGIHNDSLRCHSSKVILYQNPVQKSVDAGNISEDDWEDVMASFSD